MLSVGDTAPDFSLPSSEGGMVSLSDAVKKGPVVLHFFPFAFTGG
jgi:peroxiredoxin